MRISMLQLPLSERRPSRRGGMLRYARSRRCAGNQASVGRCGGVDLKAHMSQPPQCAKRRRLCPISGQKETLSPVGLRVSGKAPGDDLLSHGLSHTTIGAAAFHFRVRDGIGWFHSANFTRETVGASPIFASLQKSAQGCAGSCEGKRIQRSSRIVNL